MLTSYEIVEIRESYGLSQVDLAKLLVWGEATISRYESKAKLMKMLMNLEYLNIKEEMSYNYDTMLHIYPTAGMDYSILSDREKAILDIWRIRHTEKTPVFEVGSEQLDILSKMGDVALTNDNSLKRHPPFFCLVIFLNYS